MVILIQNIADFRKELKSLSYMDVKENRKGNIFVYRKWNRTIKNKIIDFLTVGDYFLIFYTKEINTFMTDIKEKYILLYTSRIGRMQFEELVEMINLIKKYKVSKIPVFDLDHLCDLGYTV